MLHVTEDDHIRTPFAYCPPPSRRVSLAYRLGRDYCALPVRAVALVAAIGGLAVLAIGILRSLGRP